MKKYVLILAAGFFVLWGIQSYAAFQWSADLNQDFTWRRGMDLHDDDNNPVATRNNIATGTAIDGKNSGEAEDFFTTLLGINGTWTMVKDTSFSFRVASQFDWLGSNTSGPLQSNVPGDDTGTIHSDNGTNPFSLWINQAHLDFNDFAGFPFSFKLGRQNVWLGKGFVLGNRLFGAGPTLYASGHAPTGSNDVGAGGKNGQDITGTMGNLPLNAITGGSLNAPEKSDFTGFDGVVGNFHFLDNKLNFDLGYLLVSTALVESQPAAGQRIVRNIGTNDNETLTFANLGYKAKKWNFEGYFLYNHDKEPATDRQDDTVTAGETPTEQLTDKIFTLGLRGDFDWLENWGKIKKVNTYLEAAFQRGKLGAAFAEAELGRNRNAQAFNVGLDTWWDTMWSPMVGFEAAWFSGMNPDKLEISDDARDAGKGGEVWTAWDPQFRGKFFTKIMDFLDSIYLTDVLSSETAAVNGGVHGRMDAGFTNKFIAQAKTSFKPLKKTNIGLSYSWISAIQPPQTGRRGSMGMELDWDLTYDLSNVTKWYFDGGAFFPGSYYDLMPGKPGDAVRRPQNAINAFMMRTGFKVNLG